MRSNMATALQKKNGIPYKVVASEFEEIQCPFLRLPYLVVVSSIYRRAVKDHFRNLNLEKLSSNQNACGV